MNTNDATAPLAQSEQRWLEDLLARFEQAWTETLLTSWIPSLPAAGTPLRRLALVGLVHIDLVQQWRKGRPAALEAYLQQFPELGGPAGVPFQLIEAEYRQRLAHNSPADLGLFVRRFPARAAELQRLIPSAALADLPAVFGRYRILRKIGRGGMGSVYLAHDTQLDRQVALKVPRFEKGKESVLRERFLREARAAATLSHPNICPVYDVGEFGGIPFVTMAFIDGRSLNEVIHATKLLPSKPIAAVVRKLARALQTAHEAGVIHRDLKPANVMIGKKNAPIIMDFGLARRTDRDERFLIEGVAIGTPEYMAPEQFSTDESGMGPACDIYGLGVVLYELLTGQVPFRGSTREVFRQVRNDLPEPPRRIRPEIEPVLEEICLKALAKDPAQRFASMEDFAAALTAFLHEPAGQAASEALFDDERQPSSSALLWESLKARFQRRRRWILAGAGGMFALILLLWMIGCRK